MRVLDEDKQLDLQKKNRALIWIMGGFFLLFYLALPIRSVYYDSLAYACQVISKIPQQFFHPHHLLYSRTNWLLWELGRMLDPQLNPLAVMTWLNSLLGALGLTFFLRICLILSRRRLISLLLTLVLGFSQAYQIFSTMPEVVIPGVFLLLVVFYLLLSRDLRHPMNACLIGIFFTLAMLYHQICFLYLPLILLLMLGMSPPQVRWRNFLVFFAASIIPVVMVYLAVMVLHLGMTNPLRWWGYITSSAHVEGWGGREWYAYEHGMQWWLISASQAFRLDASIPDDLLWLIISGGLILGLLILAVTVSIYYLTKRMWFGAIVLVFMVLLMAFLNWWVYDVLDYWVLPLALLLMVVAWGAREMKSPILALWLIFYLPAQAAVNWGLNLGRMTSEGDNIKGNAITNLIRQYGTQTPCLVTSDSNLFQRARLEGLKSVLFPRQARKDNKSAVELANLLLIKPAQPTIFLVDESLYKNYRTLLDQPMSEAAYRYLTVAFNQAQPAIYTQDRWGGYVRLWQLKLQ